MDMQVQENNALTLLKRRLNEVQKGISNILSAIEQGIFTSSTKERLVELENQKNEIEIEIAQESIARPMLDRDQIKFWFHRFRKMDVTLFENRRRLVDSFVNSIILHDDRIEFYFNFKKGAKTLSLEDLEKSSETLDTLPPKNPSLRTWIFLSIAKAMVYHQHGIAVLYLISPSGLYIITHQRASKIFRNDDMQRFALI